MRFFDMDNDLFKCVHLWALPGSQDGLICKQQQKSMPANSALGEPLGLSFSEAHRTDQLPLQRNKLSSNFLHLTRHTNETEEEWELVPVPILSYVQNGGPVDTSSPVAKSRFVIVFATGAIIRDGDRKRAQFLVLGLAP